MHFDLDDDQRTLRDTLQRFLARHYGFEQRRAIASTPHGVSDEIWHELADLGLFALPFAAEDGGLVGGAIEVMIVMEALGRGLVLEPYLPVVLLAGGVLAEAGDPAQKAAWLSPLIAGERRVALAHAEPSSRYDRAHLRASARTDGDAYRLDAHKRVVLAAPVADALIVSARVDGADDDFGLFVVDANAPGVTRRDYRLHDGSSGADVVLHDVRVDRAARLAVASSARDALDRVFDRVDAALVAESVGIITALCETTLDYLKTRRQFGQPIGRFQALQHRMVEMMIASEQSRSMAILAVMHASDADAATRRHAIAGARAYVADAARTVGQEAVQLHGGMGMVDEHIVSHWFRRLTVIGQTFGDDDHHLAVFGEGLRVA